MFSRFTFTNNVRQSAIVSKGDNSRKTNFVFLNFGQTAGYLKVRLTHTATVGISTRRANSCGGRSMGAQRSQPARPAKIFHVFTAWEIGESSQVKEKTSSRGLFQRVGKYRYISKQT